MKNNLDNNNAYNEKFYPDRQENEPQEYSQCYSCGEVLFVNDEIVDWNGILCCDIKECILKMISAKVVTLESGEE